MHRHEEAPFMHRSMMLQQVLYDRIARYAEGEVGRNMPVANTPREDLERLRSEQVNPSN